MDRTPSFSQGAEDLVLVFKKDAITGEFLKDDEGNFIQ